MRKAFQYRLYPSKAQERKLEATRITCQKWYNELLAERKTAYEERGETIGKYEQLRRVKEHKAASPWANEVHSHVLQVVVADLDRAYQAFFRRVKMGETAGYPRLAQWAPRQRAVRLLWLQRVREWLQVRRPSLARDGHWPHRRALASEDRRHDQDAQAG